MRRRAFIAGLGAAAVPFAARAQQNDLPRAGMLMSPAESDPEARTRIAAFRDALARLGWLGGQNVRLDFRWGGGDNARIKAYAELVGLAPRLIVANGTPAVAAASQLTRSIPIVFAQVMDPVNLGYIDSFAQPGRNTGFTFIDFSLIGKWFDMLKAFAPGTNRPAISVYRKFAEVGGLAAYGPDTADVFRRSASYVDRILNGEKPGDLPATLLATADEVIE